MQGLKISCVCSVYLPPYESSDIRVEVLARCGSGVSFRNEPLFLRLYFVSDHVNSVLML